MTYSLPSLRTRPFSFAAAMLPQAARAQAAQESAAAPRAYDIPPGPLTATLNWFAAETGIFLRGCLQNKL